MVMLITMDLTFAATPKYDKTVDFPYCGQLAKTWAAPINPGEPFHPIRPYPWLDEWLQTMVCFLMVTKADDMPTLTTMLSWVKFAVRERTEQWYDNPQESDLFIRNFCQTVMLTPGRVESPMGMPTETPTPTESTATGTTTSNPSPA